MHCPRTLQDGLQRIHWTHSRVIHGVQVRVQKLNNGRLFFLFFLSFFPLTYQLIPYASLFYTPFPPFFLKGNHRFSVALDYVPPAGVVAVTIPWRRHDPNPEVIVTQFCVIIYYLSVFVEKMTFYLPLIQSHCLPPFSPHTDCCSVAG